MKKILILLSLFIFSISSSFSALTPREKFSVRNAFSRYEENISKFTQNEQVHKVEELIQSMNSLLNSAKVKNNVTLNDILVELKTLAEDKHNILTLNTSS
jgi:hypothetical protein